MRSFGTIPEWEYLDIDGIRAVLGAIPFSGKTENHSFHSAPDNRMNEIHFHRICVLLRIFWWEIQCGRPRRSPGFRLEDMVVLRSPPP